ncbi:radical SAM/SPASM domain-containing protein [Marinifilum sp. D737]|uniref:radical SAM/SPASM domain-containing protein n=1 Tax=Marinifilum sp. D737 TaxID=2969628 RepID=UPI0022768A00|nr:radical SAM protein [Marinifilum sp. D737]MCY1634295.1 radical SAM protein [Marinifilum sp. D737]
MIPLNKYPLVKIIELSEFNLLYDSRKNLILKLDKQESDKLIKFLNDELEPYSNSIDFKIFRDMQIKGYLIQGGLLERCNDSILKFDKNYNKIIETIFPKKFCLEVTQNCNLRCKYCDYTTAENDLSDKGRKHSYQRMDIEIGKKAIDYYFNRLKYLYSRSERSNFIKTIRDIEPMITFYGGEPLLEFDTLKELINYIKLFDFAEYGLKRDDFNITINSNLTVLTNVMMEFVVDNNITLHISLDGPKDIHDKMRVFKNGQGSFEKVLENLNKIKTYNTNYYKDKLFFLSVNHEFNNIEETAKFFRNLSEDNISPSFDFISLTKRGQCFPNVEKEVDNLKKDFELHLNQFRSRMSILTESINENSDISFEKTYQNDVDYREAVNLCVVFKDVNKNAGSNDSLKFNKINLCPVGYYSAYVDVKGDIHICEKTDGTFCIGNIFKGVLKKNVKSIVEKFVEIMNRDDCKNCWAFYYCDFCPAYLINKGELNEPKLLDCEFMKLKTELFISKYFILVNEYSQLIDHILNKNPKIQDYGKVIELSN